MVFHKGRYYRSFAFKYLYKYLIRTSNKCKFIMYADDTTIYFNLEDFDPDNVSNEINNELEKITKWLQINKLSLNTQKNKLMVFDPQKTKTH